METGSLPSTPSIVEPSLPVDVQHSASASEIVALANGRDFRLILVDLQQPLCAALRAAFTSFLPSGLVEVVHGRFEDLPAFDCMVSAANSFGLMDGGVDAAITAYFGPLLQVEVQRRILAEFDGEQPVGTSIIVRAPVSRGRARFIAHTPTMRVPYSIRGTDYAYLAMKSMLLAVAAHNEAHRVAPLEQIRLVACTGLGTFYGKLPFDEASRQMALAYSFFRAPPREISWNFAAERQEAVRFGGEQGFRELVRRELAAADHPSPFERRGPLIIEADEIEDEGEDIFDADEEDTP